MKSNITKYSYDPNIIYPCVMVFDDRDSTITDLVVIFYAEKEGICLHPGNTKYNVGHKSNDWMPCGDKCWKVFCGKITIEV